MTVEISDIINAFTSLAEDENVSMFQQGVVLAQAIEAGFMPKDVTRECGIATGKSARTMLNRLKVGLVFGNDYCKDMDWSCHLVAATAPGVDYRDPYTHMHARAAMDIAIKGYVDPETGSHRPHTAKTLRERIAPKPVNPKPVVLFTGEVNVFSMDWYYEKEYSALVTIVIPRDVWLEMSLNRDQHAVALTITRQPLPESTAGGSEVAA